ncbi:MAG TPA: hypothetical protein VFQ36_11155 [Ktedonobacteraceae bacterium]|nr:hypothetical protein [Ktedonobacteraceae bacterium]
MDLPVPTGQKSVIPLILLLLLLAVIAFFALGSLNLAGSTTQTGQCPPFNAQQEAFNLAQRTEQFRRAKPEAVNYGNGSYTICYTNGKIAYFTFPQPFRGFYDKNAPGEEYKTHSEQATYVWPGRKLAALPLVASQIQWIQVVIFSQVIVCPPCQNDMKSWQTGLRG